MCDPDAERRSGLATLNRDYRSSGTSPNQYEGVNPILPNGRPLRLPSRSPRGPNSGKVADDPSPLRVQGASTPIDRALRRPDDRPRHRNAPARRSRVGLAARACSDLMGSRAL